jgi:hypothetical protein
MQKSVGVKSDAEAKANFLSCCNGLICTKIDNQLEEKNHIVLHTQHW